MAVIESVAVRQRGSYDFETHYDSLCALNGSCPLPAIKAYLKQNVVDINTDRIRANDWIPILNTLKINKTLEFVAVRSFYQPPIEGPESKPRSNLKKKVPAIRSKEITYRLCRAIRECLSLNFVLKTVELQGIALRDRDVESLSKGIAKNHSLQFLSVERSLIGDDLLEVLCRTIKNSMSISSVNFSACGLTWKSAEMLAELIKHQATTRHNEAWQDSLRYRKPDLDRMSGLRRININSNPLIGDAGVQILADILRDDLWVKAVDLHQCGITNVGAKSLLEILKFNTTLVVVDVRQNPSIDSEMMRNIMDQVIVNCAGQETEYKWIKIDVPQEIKIKPRKRRTRTIMGSGRKVAMRLGGSSTRKRPKVIGAEELKQCPGMPWRTALRAAQHRTGTPERGASAFESMSEASESVTPYQQKSMEDCDDYEPSGNFANDRRDHTKAYRKGIEDLRQRISEESMARMNAEKRVAELTAENNRLQKELEDVENRPGVFIDDETLDTIEFAFQQFHNFLDLLRDVGLGPLITMAGLDKTPMLFPRESPVPLANGHSRLDTTLQMKSFLEQSGIDLNESSFMFNPASSTAPKSEPQTGNSAVLSPYTTSTRMPFVNVQCENSASLRDPTSRQGYTQQPDELHGRTRLSKFDELYQRALKNVDSGILQRGSLQRPSRTSDMLIAHTSNDRPSTVDNRDPKPKPRLSHAVIGSTDNSDVLGRYNGEPTTEDKHSSSESNHSKSKALSIHSGASNHRSGEGSHRSGESNHRSGESNPRSGEGNHRSGEGNHRSGESNPRSGENSHRSGEGSRRSGDSNHRSGEGSHRSGESNHRSGESNHRSGEGNRHSGEGYRNSGESKHSNEGINPTVPDAKRKEAADLPNDATFNSSVVYDSFDIEELESDRSGKSNGAGF